MAAEGARGFAGVCVEMGAVCLRFDGAGMLLPGKGAFSARYENKKKRTAQTGGAAKGWRFAWAVLEVLGDKGHGTASVHVRMGGRDAAATALAAGAMKAGVCALMGLLPKGMARDVRIEAQPGGLQFLASARCIWTARVGDIMFAAAKAAMKNSAARKNLAKRARRLREHREGTGWISIPSRA